MQRTNPNSVYGAPHVDNLFRVAHFEGAQQHVNLQRYDAAAQLKRAARPALGVTPAEALISAQLAENLTIGGAADKPVRAYKQRRVGNLPLKRLAPEVKAYTEAKGV